MNSFPRRLLEYNSFKIFLLQHLRLIILMSETSDKTTILYLPCKKFQTLLSLLLSYIFEKRTLAQIFLKAQKNVETIACAGNNYLSCIIHSKRHGKINLKRSHIISYSNSHCYIRKFLQNNNFMPSLKAVHATIHSFIQANFLSKIGINSPKHVIHVFGYRPNTSTYQYSPQNV